MIKVFTTLFHFRPPTPPRKDSSNRPDGVDRHSVVESINSPSGLPTKDNHSPSPDVQTEGTEEQKEESNQDDDHDDTMLLRSSPAGMIAVDARGAPVVYAYAGPPSIQLATWGDRGPGPGSSRSSRSRSSHYMSNMGHDQHRGQNIGPGRSISAGGPTAYLAASWAGVVVPPPIPPPPAGYASMHHHMQQAAQYHHHPHLASMTAHSSGPPMVLVPAPQPYPAAYHPHIHSPTSSQQHHHHM